MSDKRICRNCGRVLEGIKKFCPYCGFRQDVSWSDSKEELYRSREDSYEDSFRENRSFEDSGSSREDSYKEAGGYRSKRADSYQGSGQTVYGKNQDPYRRPAFDPGPDPGHNAERKPSYDAGAYGGRRTGMPEEPGKGRGERILFGILIALLCLAIIAVSAVFVLRFLHKPDEAPVSKAEETSAEEASAEDGKEGNREDGDTVAEDEERDEDGYDAVSEEGSSQDLPNVPDGSQASYLTKKFSGDYKIKLYTDATGFETVNYDNSEDNDHLPESVFVALLGESGERMKVYYAGLAGWVDASDLEYFSDDVYYLYDDHLSEKIYQAYDLSSGGIIPHTKPSASKNSRLPEKYKISYGKEFTVKEVKEGFARIEYKEEECWVDMHYFRTYAHDSPRWQTTNQNGNSVALRSKKDFRKKYELTEIPNHEEITVTTIEQGWGKVSYNGKSGWVDLKCCTPYEP